MNKYRNRLLIAPSLLTMALFVLGGLFYSVNNMLSLDAHMLQHYIEQLFSSDIIKDSIVFTFKYTMISTIVAIVITLILLRYLVSLSKVQRSKLYRITRVPMLFPYIVVAYISVLFLEQTGMLSRIFFHMGIIQSYQQFPIIISDPYGIGIIISYVIKTTPFILMMTYPSYVKTLDSHYETCIVLGCRNRQIFFDILLPSIIKPLIIAAFVIFSFIFTAIEIPSVLGPTFPKSISHYAFNLFQTGNIDQRSFGLFINIVMLVFFSLLGLLVFTVFNKEDVNEK